MTGFSFSWCLGLYHMVFDLRLRLDLLYLDLDWFYFLIDPFCENGGEGYRVDLHFFDNIKNVLHASMLKDAFQLREDVIGCGNDILDLIIGKLLAYYLHVLAYIVHLDL